jgi:HD-GYP domain-containing protein (c-di-GMP phosphodiesterase class II)
VDLISPVLDSHHKRVAYIALRLAQQLDLPEDEQRQVFIAAALHDIGAFSEQERLDTLDFELEEGCERHAESGYMFLRAFPPFKNAAEIVRHHHQLWLDGAGANLDGQPVPAASHLLHLADRIEVLIDRKDSILRQVHYIRRKIEREAGRMFVPEHVEAFTLLSEWEYFWLDLAFPALELILRREARLDQLELDTDELTSMAKMFCRLIDYKSGFTATHSSGVSACAAMLAGLVGFSPGEQQEIAIAGLLHDLGKLAVPGELLEKPDKLSDDEFCVMQAHAYYSRRILEDIDDLSTIINWGSAHHERLDGRGYPFREEGCDLPLGARIMAVADVFTALTEDRPYRNGMGTEKVLDILGRMAGDGKLDMQLVRLLAGHYEELDQVRQQAQRAARREYREYAEIMQVGG